MEHFAPHSSSAFEGWYFKFDLSSGAHIALIVCSVPNAKDRPHMVSFTYYPKTGSPIFQRNHWVSDIKRVKTGPGHAFELQVPDLGSVTVGEDSSTNYSFACSEWSLEAATSSSHTPWSPQKNTPEGWLVHLPLPLHWHVHSLYSPCTFKLNIPSLGLNKADYAIIHQEKNWASSFPSSHMWIQARDADNGVCLAGGKILGLTAYLISYRSPDLNLDFVPPFAVSALGLSPFMSISIDYASRAFAISVSSLLSKMELKASAPRDEGWFQLACPFPEGFRKNFCTENFLANIEVKISRRGSVWPWMRAFWAWEEVRTVSYQNASLEFAGGYYPDRGEKRE
ncbi:hypothetical protein BS50DRAFT_653537 [Corynespora cassiicola Philippines]|uniref:Uncharacterized protein n=1 Tax=Corynespora cassiicola Philippines TaxID=1448308 RepID=A0A2T2P5X1_CORCC|nr:hypothetical protein BS50DRAFT_653537 [Corynespora cassiicola Philippines]